MAQTAKKKKIIAMASIVLVALSLAVLFACTRGGWLEGSPGKIALIHIDGIIVGGRGYSSVLFDQKGTDTVIRQLREARLDPEVKAVLLRINSPGGSVPATQEVAAEVRRVKEAGKPVVVSMGDMAASGAYWIAAMADKIYANPGTITGSIGVYFPYANWEGLYRKLGIREEKIKSGPHKDILSPERPMTAEERAIIQGMVDAMYAQFVAAVAEGRKLSPARVRELADGRIYTGSQAQELGLVDELGDFYDAVEGTAALAGLPSRPQLKEYGKVSPWALLLGPWERLSRGLDRFLTPPAGEETLMPVPMAIPARWLVPE